MRCEPATFGIPDQRTACAATQGIKLLRVFFSGLSLLSLVNWSGGLVRVFVVRLIGCQIILTAAIQGSVDLPLTCDPSLSLITFAFRSSELRCLVLDLDPYGGT